jgi:hypothetical protein
VSGAAGAGTPASIGGSIRDALSVGGGMPSPTSEATLEEKS